MKYLLIIMLGAALVCAGLCYLAGDLTDAAADAQTPVQASTPAWRVEWRGSTRYMKRGDTWHVWTPNSTWVALPPSIVEAAGLN